MRRPRGSLLLLALAMSACQLTGTPVRRPVHVGASVPAATAVPAVAPPRAALQAPTTPTSVLTGQVSLDASFAVAARAGALASDGKAVVMGDGIVANNGGGIVANNGGGIVANNGGGIISSEGGNMIAATTGGQAVSAPGGELLAAGGIVANHGAGRRVLADAPAPAPGTVLPAAGMVVSAVSLKTHAYLPVGVDPSGKPVYGIYTDVRGQYKLYVDKAESGNVLVVANPPGAQDAKLAVGDLAPVTAASVRTLDPDTANAVRLVRGVLAAQLAEMLTTPDIDGEVNVILGKESNLPAAIKTELVALVTTLHDAGQADGIPSGPTAFDIPEVREAALLTADAVLARLDYDSLRISPLTAQGYKGAPDQAYEALGKTFADLRDKTAGLIAKKVAAGATLPFTVDVPIWHAINTREDNCARTAHVPVAQATDLGTFLVSDVFGRYHIDDYVNASFVFEATNIPFFVSKNGVDDPADPDYFVDPQTHEATFESERLKAASFALLFAVTTTLLPLDRQPGDPPTAGLAAALDIGKAFAASHPTFSSPQPRPFLGGTPCYPPGPLSPSVPPGPQPSGAILDEVATPGG